VGIETRLDDQKTMAYLAPLNHAVTADRVKAERAVNNRLQGGCQVPIGVYSEINGDTIVIEALVGEVDGSHIIQYKTEGLVADGEALGVALAEKLLANGAGRILDAL